MILGDPAPVPMHPAIPAVRGFNRFYTRHIGVLDDHILQSPYSLAEGRVLFELAARDAAAASDLAEDLRLDPGYLSRIVRRFRDRGLVEASPSSSDGRRQVLALTAAGRSAFAALDAAAHAEVEGALDGLADADLDRLTRALWTVERTLGSRSWGPVTTRAHRPGDMGWVVQRHGEIYAAEYGWDETFEALVARICSDFVENLDPHRERCWIAEADGERLGCVFLVRDADDPEHSARLRMLLVEPSARGLGIGRTLVHTCTEFARGAGYERIVLWTNDVLAAARHLYQEEGYRLVHEGAHHSFGHDLVEQTWELTL